MSDPLIEPRYARERWADLIEVEADRLDVQGKRADLCSQIVPDSYRGPARRAALDAIADAAQLLRDRAADLRLPWVTE